MGQTKIEWTSYTRTDGRIVPGYTFNPWLGCSKVSPACRSCYAEAWAKRSGLVQWGDNAERRRTSESNWRQPLKWNKEAQRAGERRRVFCASLADVFEDHPTIMPGWRADLGRLILDTPYLDWLLLTKRPENVMRLALDFWVYISGVMGGLPKNVWVGTTCENQEMADRRIPELLLIPAAVRFLSCEPLLGPINLIDGPWWDWRYSYDFYPKDMFKRPIDWVIAGGESGPHARPMHPEWARSLRDACASSGVSFFMKQMGSGWAKEFNAKDKKGGDWDEWPEDLRVRQFPSVHSFEQAR
jgi:protein gp37